MSEIIAWLEGTALAAWVRESPSIWAYPTVLTLHTVGLGLVVGVSAIVDARLLGFGRRIPLHALSSLFAILWAGLVVNAVTGLLLFIADATTKSGQPVFYVKLGLIALALWTTLSTRRVVFGGSAASRGDDALPPGIGRTAVLSLLLWAGAITAGRLMAYLV